MKRAIAVIDKEIQDTKFNIRQCVPEYHGNLVRELDVLRRVKRKLRKLQYATLHRL